jgi:hypothetical protein
LDVRRYSQDFSIPDFAIMVLSLATPIVPSGAIALGREKSLKISLSLLFCKNSDADDE